MKTKNLMIALSVAAAMGVSLYACKKETSAGTSEQAAVNMAVASNSSQELYDDSFDIASQSSEQSNLSVNTTGGVAVNALNTNSTTLNSFTATAGATITVLPADPAVYPKTITIDFGAGVTSANGIIRKGKIIVTLTGKLRVAGSIISVTYNNYSVNGYQLTGVYSLTPRVVANAGVNYDVTVTNGSVTTPTGEVYTYSGTKTFTQTAGIGTFTVADDTYAITGSFSFSSTAKGSITGTITTPLVKSADCKNISSGIIAFVYNGVNGTLDFGAGTCDNQATLKFGATVKTVTLPR